MEFTIRGIPYLIVGALVWWLFYGNLTAMTAIPFVGMLFFWPLFLIYKFIVWAFFWGMIALCVLITLGGGYLWHERWQVKRERAKMMRRARGL